MPPFTERESSILSKLKKKKPPLAETTPNNRERKVAADQLAPVHNNTPTANQVLFVVVDAMTFIPGDVPQGVLVNVVCVALG